MLRLAAQRDEVSVVADQWGSPTPASACADAALSLTRALLDRDPSATGVFHAAGRDDATWADFAEAIFAVSAHSPLVRSDYRRHHPTAARRPRDTRLSIAKLEGALAGAVVGRVPQGMHRKALDLPAPQWGGVSLKPSRSGGAV